MLQLVRPAKRPAWTAARYVRGEILNRDAGPVLPNTIVARRAAHIEAAALLRMATGGWAFMGEEGGNLMSIGSSGKRRMGRFPMAGLFTTSTATEVTTGWRT